MERKRKSFSVANMKIGLYGGLANNMYITAKALARQGLRVHFIRDRGTCFPFAQPFWEDVPCVLSYEEVAEADHWTWEDCHDLEERLGWSPPHWYVDPLGVPGLASGPTEVLASRFHQLISQLSPKTAALWLAVLKQMRKCDVLLVSGVEGPLLALASGKPFAIVPHGADIRMAAGLYARQPLSPCFRAVFLAQLVLLRLAYKKALWIADNCPGGIEFRSSVSGALGEHVHSRFHSSRFERFLFPFFNQKRLPESSRRELLSGVMGRLRLKSPTARWIGFVPSRIDFYWKGTDRLFRALQRLPANSDFHLIVSGWGVDYERAKGLVAGRQITFLPCVFSKPILYDLFKAVDFVADQFALGYYGTSALEAMSCGVPVIMWIDDEGFLRDGFKPPPVLNARSEEDIGLLFRSIASGKIDLEAASRSVSDWVHRVHSPESVVSQLREAFAATLSGSSVG